MYAHTHVVYFEDTVLASIESSSFFLNTWQENMDAQLDHEEQELQQWSHLSEAFTLPALSMKNMRKIPLIGR